MASATLYAAEQAAPTVFADWWMAIPWGWFALFLSVIWLGGQLNQIDEGQHWIVVWLRKRRLFCQISEIRQEGLGQEKRYLVEIDFLRDANNVNVRIETYFAEMSFFGQKWKRFSVSEPLKNQKYNKGGKVSVKLVELRPADNEHPSTLKGHRAARMKAKLSLSATNFRPLTEERIMLLTGSEVQWPPFNLPNEEGGNSIDFNEGEAIIWVEK